MALMNIKNFRKESGFTIVELLIVIVVIAILATISIVAYTGVQNRAKTSAGNELASQVLKKLESLNAVKGTYYSNTTAGGLSGANMNTFATATPVAPEGQLDKPGSVLAATDAAGAGLTQSTAQNGTVVYAWACANGTGASVFYWDFTVSTGNLKKLTAGTAC